MESLAAAVVIPEVEVAEKAARRRFSAEYKRTVLKEAETCGPGEIGALLRRKGLYSSHLSVWRDARDRGEIAGLAPKKRGLKRGRRFRRSRNAPRSIKFTAPEDWWELREGD